LGGFTEDSGINLPGVVGANVAWGDYSGDGKLDLIIAGYNNNISITRLYKNTGLGGFIEDTSANLPGIGSGSVAWGDYSGDGKLDLIIRGGVTKLYKNNGSGLLIEDNNIVIPNSTGIGSVAAWGDYSGDGKLDLVVTSLSGSMLYRNDGNGSLTQDFPILVGVAASNAAWGDYNQDGRLDLIITGKSQFSGNSVSKLYKNMLGGWLSKDTSVNLPGIEEGAVAWGDYTGDGKLDLLMTGISSGSSVNFLLKNNGNGGFTQDLSMGSALPAIRFGDVAWADYSGDGRSDLLYVGTGIAQLYKAVNPNVAPVVTVFSGTAIPSYTENTAPRLFTGWVVVTDSDSLNFDTGKLTVRIASGSQPSDRLSIQPQTFGGLTPINLDGRKVRFGTQEIGTYTGGIGSENLVVTFNANATPDKVQEVIKSLSFANVSENPDNTDRMIEYVLTDGDGGTSTAVTTRMQINPVNDAPIIGARQVLYNGITAPGSQGWTTSIPVGVGTISNLGVTTVDTNGNAGYTAGFSRFDKTLNAAEGFALSFQASVLSETLTATADKNLDGKTDRAAFSLTLVTSDKTKAIELGFTKTAGGLRIFAQEDGTKQINPALEPDTAIADRTRQLFTQAEGITLTDPGLGNYDLYVKDDSYTLFLNGTAILSGKLRNYTAFTGPIDPYERPNLIAFSDNTPSASGSFQLGRVALLSGAIANQTMNEDGTLSGITFGAIDVETYSPTVTVSSSNTTVVPNGSNLQMTGTTVDRSLTIYPGINQSGNAVISLTANDGSTTSNTAFNLTVDASNDPPSFTASNPLSGIAGSGVQTVTNWATFSPGGGLDEAGQTATYQVVSNSNSAIFAVAPAIAPNGTPQNPEPPLADERRRRL
jgi:FG-GAP-like repeat